MSIYADMFSASTLVGVVQPVNGGTGVSSPTAHTLPVAEGAAPYNFIGPLTNGQLLVGSTGVDPVAAAITSTGGSINVTLGAGTINIETVDGGFKWNDQTADLNPILKENGYFADKGAGRVALTLPTTAAMGDTFAIAGFGANGWQLNAGAGQIIKIGSQTTAVAGNLQSTNALDQMEVVCSPTTTTFIVRHVIGNITVN